MFRIEEDIARELERLQNRRRYRELCSTGRRDGCMVGLGDRMMLNLSSNDYLGIGSDSALLASWRESQGTEVLWLSATASRLLGGNHGGYDELEELLGVLYGGRSALVFNSGYHANIGILPALAARSDLIVSDRLNHASIHDALRLSRAKSVRYPHRDYDRLEEILESAQDRYRQVFIVTESVFSMDGDLADLKRLARLRQRYNAMLVVDEAHGIGVFGRDGLGLCQDQGVLEQCDIIIGTFGKAYASLGAFALLRPLFRSYLVNTMRPLLYTTALPPMLLSWTRYVLALQQSEEMARRRRKLMAMSHTLRAALREQGFVTAGASQIIPVIVGSDHAACDLASRLQDQGFLAMPVRPPTVPEGQSRLRISLRADLEDEHLHRFLGILGNRGEVDL